MKLIFCDHKNKGLVSKGIRFFTRGASSHNSWLIDENLLFEAREGAGVHTTEIDPKDEITYYIFEADDEAIEDGVNFAIMQLGKKYDWTSFRGFISRTTTQARRAINKWFCTEIISAFASKCKNPLFNTNKHFLCKPSIFHWSHKLTKTTREEAVRIVKDQDHKNIVYPLTYLHYVKKRSCDKTYKTYKEELKYHQELISRHYEK